MKAPDKIYLTRNLLGELRDGWDALPSEIFTNIEYTRTDAFIEKAISWLKENADHYVGHYLNDDDTYMDESFIEDFKKYMKGE